MASAKRLAGATLALLLGLPLLARAELYCCQNPANGHRTCGDTLPEVCQGRAYKVIGTNGNVLREVGPPLTAEQKAAAQLQAQQKQEQEARRLEQRRRDGALLQTYAAPEDIDLAQKKAEGDVQLSITEVNSRLDGLRKQLAKFQAEAGGRERNSLPVELQRNLRNAEQDIKTQESLREQKQQDLAKIRERYDTDRRRYVELTGRSSGQPTATGDSRPH